MACFFWGFWISDAGKVKGCPCVMPRCVGLSLGEHSAAWLCLSSEMRLLVPSFHPCALCCVTLEFLELQPVFTHCLCALAGCWFAAWVSLWCKKCCLSCLLLCTKGSQEAQSPAWMCPVFVWLKSKWVIWRGFTEAGVLTPLFFCDKPLFPLWWGSPVRQLVCIRGFFGGLPVNAVKREVQVRLSSLGMFTGLSKP